MIDVKQINPTDPRQARLFYCLLAAHAAGEKRHPQHVVRDLEARLGFKVLGWVPQTIADGWDVWIEHDDPASLALPPLFRAGAPWKPVGQA
jgi:hypothetical protein